VVGLRRHVQALSSSGVITRLRNEIIRIRQQQQTTERRQKKRGLEPRYSFTPEQARLLSHDELLHRIDSLASEVIALEDDSLSKFYTSQPLDAAWIEEQWSLHDRTFRQILFDVPRTDAQERGTLTIAVFGESLSSVVELMQLYEGICRNYGDQLRWFSLKMYRPEFDESAASPGKAFHPPSPPRAILRLLSRQEQEDDKREKVVDVYQESLETLASPAEDCIGIALEISGERSAALLETESGWHEFVRANGHSERCVVETVLAKLREYDPPKDIGRRGSLKDKPMRRVYDLRKEECRDELLARTIPIRSRRIDQALEQAVEQYLTVRLWEVVEAWS
jgi:hypothetical protein